MQTNAALVVIKPLSIGRGDGPAILQEILDNCRVSLVRFRSWIICDTTWKALDGDEQERSRSIVTRNSWIGLFEGDNPHRDTFQILTDYFGPEERTLWTPKHLRYKYGMFKAIGNAAHPDDTVVRLSHPERMSLEAQLLF